MLQQTTIDAVQETIDKLTAQVGDLASLIDKSDKIISHESLLNTSKLITEGKPLPEGSADARAVALSAAAILNCKCDFLRKSLEILSLKMILDADATAQRDADFEARLNTLENRTVGMMFVGGRS